MGSNGIVVISQCLVSHIEIHITYYGNGVFVCACSQLSGDDFFFVERGAEIFQKDAKDCCK